MTGIVQTKHQSIDYQQWWAHRRIVLHSHVETAVLLTHCVTIYCTSFATSLSNSSPFVSNIEEERKVMNDERREHSAVDESSLEQQICESDDHTLIVRKTGVLAPVEPGLMSIRPAGWQAIR